MKRRKIADDAAARRLRCSGNPEAMDIILQDECRRRASRKLAATLLCPDFRFPTALSAEQCTSDEVAAFHASLIPPGASVVDLTAGLGIDAFHCAAVASRVHAMDIDPVVATALNANAAALGLTNVAGICADCRSWLAESSERFDVAFIDPARRGENGRRLFGLHDCSPDVVELLPEIARRASRLIVKTSPMLDITAMLRDEGLKPSALTIVGTRSECKEIILDFDFGKETDVPVTKAVTVGGFPFGFTLGQGSEMNLADPGVGDLAGEPWPAVMKSGAFNQIPGRRIHPDTHLYILTPDEAAEFPGEVYRIASVTPFSSSQMRQAARSGIDASVAVKNFPLSAEELRKRLRARENSARRLMGVTSRSGRLLIELEICNFAPQTLTKAER